MLENLETLSQRIREHDTDELLIAEMNKLVARGIGTKDETLRAGARDALRAITVQRLWNDYKTSQDNGTLDSCAGRQAENEIEAR